jgi:hypothetical protein
LKKPGPLKAHELGVGADEKVLAFAKMSLTKEIHQHGLLDFFTDQKHGQDFALRLKYEQNHGLKREICQCNAP